MQSRGEQQGLVGVSMLIAVALIVAACGGTEPKALPQCHWPRPALQIDSVGVPVIAWSPGCRAHGLRITVGTDTAPATVWEITTGENHALVPGIRYGVTPRGATLLTPAAAIVPGEQYIVFLTWRLDESGDTYQGKTFVAVAAR